MREIRQSGSVGGAGSSIPVPTPIVGHSGRIPVPGRSSAVLCASAPSAVKFTGKLAGGVESPGFGSDSIWRFAF